VIHGNEYQNLSTEGEWLRALTRIPVAFLEASLTWRECQLFAIELHLALTVYISLLVAHWQL
jgi:hypothetical protein